MLAYVPRLTVLCGVLITALPGCSKKVPEPEPLAKPAAVSSTQSSSSGLDEIDEAAHAVLDADADAPADARAGKTITELETKDLKVGSGPAANTGDTLRVHYTGRLLNGRKFDSSLDRREPFEFTLGQGQVIQGWDQGVVGMKKGGKRKLIIPAEMAYGKVGSPPKIPPDAPLQFEIELLEIRSN